MRIHMPLKDTKYDIILDHKAILQLPHELSKWYTGKQIFILTDETVYKLHGDKLTQVLQAYHLEYVVVKPGENSKSMATYEMVMESLLDKQMKRGELLIAFGGGVIGDLGGFVASTLFRGVPYVQIPTTLLSQVDSSIGGKTAINSHNSKNMIGTFYQPKLVIIDIDFLSTLSDFEYKNGMAEIIKSACIGDPVLFDQLDHNNIKTLEMIERTLNVKKAVVMIDEFDLKERMFLNFGHTFGHALEKQSAYKIAHGYAVAEGMMIAVHIGEALKITAPSVKKRLKSILEKYDLGLLNTDPLSLMSEIAYDKKNIMGNLTMIFIQDIGQPIAHVITKEVIHECYNP